MSDFASVTNEELADEIIACNHGPICSVCRERLGELRDRAATAEAQRDAWAARYTDLANAVLEGVYLNYDVKEDSGGSTFLCTCSHDGDGFPHEEWCGALLTSTLGDA